MYKCILDNLTKTICLLNNCNQVIQNSFAKTFPMTGTKIADTYFDLLNPKQANFML